MSSVVSEAHAYQELVAVMAAPDPEIHIEFCAQAGEEYWVVELYGRQAACADTLLEALRQARESWLTWGRADDLP